MKPGTSGATPSLAMAWNSGAHRFSATPSAACIAEASHDKEEVLIGEVDLRVVEDVRRNWPFLRDRRIDSYGADHEQAKRLMTIRACGDGSPTRPGRAKVVEPLAANFSNFNLYP